MTEPPDSEGELAQLRDDVDELLALAGLDTSNPHPLSSAPAASPAGPSARAHVWHALTAKEAADAWDALIGWVDWLIARYGLDDTVPACWYRHGALVDELDALRAAWTDAYLAPSAKLSDACHWLAQLASSTARIHTWDRYGCAAGTHRDDDPAPSAKVVCDERLTFVQADTAARVSAPDETSPILDDPRGAAACSGDGPGVPARCDARQ